MVTALIGVCSTLWAEASHAWRWVIVAVIAYTAISMPIVTVQTLRMYWNAGDAAKENRRLLGIADPESAGGGALT
jgi:hypothetical protein